MRDSYWSAQCVVIGCRRLALSMTSCGTFAIDSASDPVCNADSVTTALPGLRAGYNPTLRGDSSITRSVMPTGRPSDGVS
jgi:hypothetical protein